MSHECANKHAPSSLGMPDRSEEHMILPPQMSCPTSSVSLWTRRRPSSHSTPSPRCRFEASVWIQPEVYNLANPLITTRSSHRARPAPLFTVSLQEGKTWAKQRMMGDLMWRTDFIFLFPDLVELSYQIHAASVIPFHFCLCIYLFFVFNFFLIEMWIESDYSDGSIECIPLWSIYLGPHSCT